MIERMGYIVEIIEMIYVYDRLFLKNTKNNAITVLFFVIDVILVEMICIDVLPEKTSVVICILSFIYLKLKFGESIIVTAFKFISGYSFICLVQFFVVAVGNVFFIELYNRCNKLFITNIFVLVFSVAICNWSKCEMFINAIILRFKKYKNTEAYILTLLIYIVLLFKERRAFESFDIVVNSMLIIITSLFLMFWQKEQLKTEMNANNLKMQSAYSEAFAGMIREIRRKQHDFDNHLNAIYGLHLTTDNYEELVSKQRKYCDGLVESNKYNKMLGDKSSDIITGFLYVKFSDIDNSGIKVIPHIAIEKMECRVSQYELIEIMGVLLDNAAEAAFIQPENNRIVKVFIHEHDDIIKIKVLNTSDYMSQSEIERIFEEGYSTKGKDRGIGLYKVSEVIKKCKGKIVAESLIEEEIFWIQITVVVPKR